METLSMWQSLRSRSCLAVAAIACAGLADEAQPRAGAPPPAAPQRRLDPSLVPIQDEPGLPRVLLIGDSISMGYTIPTRELLMGKASLHRIPTNGGPTTNGVANLTGWLGTAKWDVIHFNWGLHDLVRLEDGKLRVPPGEYEKNLRALVSELKKTGAKLIWAATTPVPAGELKPPRQNESVIAYNEIAARIMTEHGVVIDDLYAFALPRLAEIQLPVNVHFTPGGYKRLAEPVAASILAALQPR
jgi:acyl-CoA thioesterase-1